MSSEGVGTLRAASEECTRVIISRESRESHKILLYAFGGIDVICVSKNLGRCTQTSLHSHRSSPKNLFLMFFCLILLAGLAWFTWVNFGRCTQTSLLSSLIAQDPKTCSFVLLSKIKICGHLSNLCHQRANEKSFTKPNFRINPAGK